MQDTTPRPVHHTHIYAHSSGPRAGIMNLFVRELIVVVVIVCSVSCFALPRTESQVDRKFLCTFLCTRNDYSFTRAIKFSSWKESKAGQKPLLTYTNIQWICWIGLIRRYWFQYKKIKVIFAYLQLVHYVAVGWACQNTWPQSVVWIDFTLHVGWHGWKDNWVH